MKLRFVKECELELVENFDETTEITDTVLQIFRVGDIEEVETENETERYWDILFGDGSVAFCIQKALTEVLED